jgi:hypothetical protein
LKQIQDALLIANEEQKPDLQQVVKDLEEIILLTETSLSSAPVQEDNDTSSANSQNESNLDVSFG